MKRPGKIAVGLAGALTLNAILRAASPAPADSPLPGNPSPDNPYAVIAARNVFGLNPPAPLAPPEDPTKDLPKITPQGIMGIFGNYQVLFKVSPPKPTPADKDEYYILSEGQRQDDIEVVKIDEKKSMVTFDNHGTPQELPLVETAASGGAAPSAPAGANPGVPGASGAPGAVRGNSGPSAAVRFGATPSAFNGGAANSAPALNGGPGPGPNGGLNFGNASTQGHIYQPPASTMSPEDAQIILAAQHLKAQTEGNPAAKLFPPSVIDKEAGIEPNAH